MRFIMRKRLVLTLFLLAFDIGFCQSPATPAEPEVSTVEPEAAPGCKAPVIRINPPPKKNNHAVIEADEDEETTPSYLPEDFTTTDADSFVDSININVSPENAPAINPYQIDDVVSAVHEPTVNEHHSDNSDLRHQQRNEQMNKKRRQSTGRRRRKENENGHGRMVGVGTRGARYKRDISVKSVEIGKWKERPIDIDDTYYIDVSDLYKTKSLDKSLAKRLRTKMRNEKMAGNLTHFEPPQPSEEPIDGEDDGSTTNIFQKVVNLFRVKRKSGKTTGALSRPKGGSDSGSKSTSRKGDKSGIEEEGYYPVHPDEEEEEEEEEEEDLDAHAHFGDVSEIHFPGEVGPLGDPRLCKIRCVKGKWVGPLCATNEEDKNGNIQFQPLYKSCHVNRIPPHLLLSYRNISVAVGWDLPHGHSLQARCKDLGLYKLLGEARVLCSNGLWAPRMPSCVPTTLLTNFSDDSPPSVRIKITSGSGAFEPSGVLAVLPGSTIHLDCMYPRSRGNPEWSWTSWHKKYATAWSSNPEEKSTKYRLTIRDITLQDSGSFTCSSPRGLTNSISIIVASSSCPKLPEPLPPLTLGLEGYKLGNRALYRCPLGYTVEGSINSTCLASGNWSSPPPTCQAVQCPPLFLEDSHLSLTELNTSAWGKAVFKCQWGFKLNGPSSLECQPNGVWSGPVPRCRAIQCPAPIIPLNGRIDGTSGTSTNRRYAVAALVTFSCNEGHTLEGEASIVCTETGLWSHSPPYCKSQCPYPGDPSNGLIAPLKFHYDPGDVLSVQCRSGFVEVTETQESGPPKRPECLPDGNWSLPIPQCRNYEEV